MQQSVAGNDRLHWHQALAYAIVGRRLPGLGAQSTPSIPELARLLVDECGADGIAAVIGPGRHQPHPVPADLMTGLGYAQFGAALTMLRRELGVDGTGGPTRVGTAVPLTAADRRLLDEVPPHHGT